jgi:predicted glycoside hydrolase/deacetylase ChbG (UPF0249 family)
MPFVEWVVFRILKVTNQRTARNHGLHVANAVYGLSRSDQVDEEYLLNTLTRSVGCIEFFTHPEMASKDGCRELEALTSSALQDKLASQGIALVGYRDIPTEAVIRDALPERL